MSEELNLDRVSSLRFRPTRDADEFLSYLRSTLVPGERYRVARLAIARSLAETGDVPAVPRGTEMASAIEGTHLFGEDKSLWAALVVNASPSPITASDEFRAAVEAHWHRGGALLRRDWEECKDNDVEFAVLLASLAGPSARAHSATGPSVGGFAPARLAVRFGEIGIDHRSNAPVEVVLNAPGHSPHMAIMGATRSGKTRTGFAIAERIAADAAIPILLIDPKGELVRDGKLCPVPEWGGRTLASKFPGIEPIDLRVTPVPLDFLAVPPGASETDLAGLAMEFKDSFGKCLRNQGDVALDTLRLATLELLRGGAQNISLETILDELKRHRTSRRRDSIEAKLSELTSLRLFEPALPPGEFFRRRWVVSLGGASDEASRLVMFLLLDALAHHLMSLDAAPVDGAGHRGVRHLLIVDEAVQVVRHKHEALRRLVRQSASKGGIVMLLSQSPDDFEQADEDFLENMGVIAAFKSQIDSVRGLRAIFGPRVRPEDFADSALPRGVALVKLPEQEPRRVVAWK